MDVGLFQRYSRSGRRITDHYQHETSLEDITHSPNRKEVDDLENHDRATESERQAEEQKDSMVEIQEFIRTKGYNTILDLFLDHLLTCCPRQKKEIRQAMNNDGIAKILSFCYCRSITDTPKIPQEICRHAGMIFEREIGRLVQSNELRAPMKVLQYCKSI
jgi:hypothetical protein